MFAGKAAMLHTSNNVRFGSLADICAAKSYVRFTPRGAGLRSCHSAALLEAARLAASFIYGSK
jgi:hypothetical protein